MTSPIQVLRQSLGWAVVLVVVEGSSAAAGDGLPGVSTIADLDRQAGLHFAIMSDNKGDSPLSSVECARMAAWVEEGRPAFVVGMGDHLKHGWENTFIPWIKGDRWWREHFYPNVADGENEYYGPTHAQSAYGAGAPILDLVDLRAHASVHMGVNGCEYYAKIRSGACTVHLLQMHFSDEPEDPRLAFPEVNRAWMIRTLAGIRKGEKDIIVVGAHSREGQWDQVLSPDQLNALLHKADLILSATTHRFVARVPAGYEEGPAVCVNTGAVNYPGYMSPNGYVEIHVLQPRGEIVGQYIDLTVTERRLQRGRYAWVKARGERMRPIDLRPEVPGDDTAEVVGTLTDSVGAADLRRELATVLKDRTGAHLAHVEVRSGLSAGPVTREAAWRVFQKNRLLRVVRVPATKAEAALARMSVGQTPPGVDTLRVAVAHSTIAQILARAGLTHQDVEPQDPRAPGLREVDLVLAWLKSR